MISNIRIDCREKDLITELNGLDNFNVERLELGDLIIENEENIVIVERKTYSDLISSILDGRFREQKKRLLLFKNESQKNCFVVFLIEQNNYPAQFKKHLYSSLINLNFLYDFKIVYSKNTSDSADIIRCLISKDFITQKIEPKTEKEELTNLKKYKKNCGYSNFVKMLTSIDGISLNTSLAIEKNGICNISSLIDILQNNPERLEQIPVNEKKFLSKNIINKLKIGLNL